MPPRFYPFYAAFNESYLHCILSDIDDITKHFLVSNHRNHCIVRFSYRRVVRKPILLRLSSYD